MVPSAPKLPAIVVMFSALRKPTQVYGMTAALTACLRSWLLRLWVPDAWGLGTNSMKQNVLAGYTAMCTGISSRLASRSRGVVGRNADECATTTPA